MIDGVINISAYRVCKVRKLVSKILENDNQLAKFANTFPSQIAALFSLTGVLQYYFLQQCL